jgi:hypothetical protein
MPHSVGMPDRSIILAVAAAAVADPRSVQAVIGGRRLRGDVDRRVRHALESRGITPPPPSEIDGEPLPSLRSA